MVKVKIDLPKNLAGTQQHLKFLSLSRFSIFSKQTLAVVVLRLQWRQPRRPGEWYDSAPSKPELVASFRALRTQAPFPSFFLDLEFQGCTVLQMHNLCALYSYFDVEELLSSNFALK